MTRGRYTESPICIAGMHRSGTSVITHMIGKAGLELGRDADLFAPSAANEDGFWEHRAFVGVNEALLARLGGSWSQPPDVDERSCDGDIVREFRPAVAATLRDISTDRIWGWKDPRNSLTLLFWRRIFPGLRVLICVRHPLDAAASLCRRSDLTLESSLNLWRIYNERALASIPIERRLVTAYEAYFDTSRDELRRVVKWAGLEGAAGGVQHAREVLLPALRHHRSVAAQGPHDLPASVRELYARLCAEAEWNPADAVPDDASAPDSPRLSLWGEWLRASASEVMAHLPPDTPYILIDHHSGLEHEIAGRQPRPFLERHGQYWGHPPDDVTAIRELERMRTEGVRMVVFTWLAFWWATHYAGFHRYLQTHFRCVADNQRVRAFDLSTPAAP